MGAEYKEENAFADVVKVVMAILVIGIHTEPFSFNIWLDRGFGIITRLCVPFFFVLSSYFFFKGKRSLVEYISRIGILYGIWSMIYLPFDISSLSTMSVLQIAKRYLWIGNDHALWYLIGLTVATVIVFLLKRFFSTKTVLCISVIVLILGCAGSTWSPLTEKLIGGGYKELVDFIGTRNGLFYGFPYVAMGLWLSENGFPQNRIHNCLGFFISMCLLAGESVLFVMVFKTQETILWISVFPAIYYFTSIVLNMKINMRKDSAIFLRKLSSMIYVSHGLFIICFRDISNGVVLFSLVTICAMITATIIVMLSKRIRVLRWLY